MGLYLKLENQEETKELSKFNAGDILVSDKSSLIYIKTIDENTINLNTGKFHIPYRDERFLKLRTGQILTVE